MAETTTIYVTKGAEKKGVQKMQAELRDGGQSAAEIGPDGLHSWRRDGYFWHTEFKFSEAEAIADAEKRRAKKIASLEKQIAAMKALNLSTAVEG